MESMARDMRHPYIPSTTVLGDKPFPHITVQFPHTMWGPNNTRSLQQHYDVYDTGLLGRMEGKMTAQSIAHL